MHVSKYLFIFVLVLTGASSGLAGDLQNCLTVANKRTHRIDREEGVRFCFTQYKQSTDNNSCVNLLEKSKLKALSSSLKDEMRSLCFYETTPPKDIASCRKDAKKFKDSYNHDEAIFYCYEQFQEKISKKECLESAEDMIFPSKKEYLKEHCLSNN